jgi:hypothetical protein
MHSIHGDGRWRADGAAGTVGREKPDRAAFAEEDGFFHLCFEMENLEAVLKCLRESNEAAVVCEAALAPAIGHRRVAFVVTADRDLIEFVETARP